MRKGSPCATIIKCIGAFSHSEKGVSEWVKVYEAKNAARVSAKRERTVYITHGSAGHARSCLYQLAYRGTSEEQFYDTHLYKLCDEAGIKKILYARFTPYLRHERAIESGVQPKVLQKLLGHASIKTTMDRYVHVTAESLDYAIKQFLVKWCSLMKSNKAKCENGVKMV